MSTEHLPYRLRLPGPTTVPERVRLAMARPAVNHRGPEFAAILGEISPRLQQLMGTANEVLLLATSGTGVMEAGLANALSPGDKALIVNSGQFGERFATIAAALGIAVDTIDVPWGKAVDAAELAHRLEGADYRAVVAVHNESSTGAVADLAAIGKAVAKTPSLLVVDSVSGLGGIDVKQDDWGVDILVSASQKALMCPPGIGVMSVSPKAWRVIEQATGMPRFYWDLRKAREAAAKGQTAFTPALSIAYGLQESLRMIFEEGPAAVLARHRRLADAMRQGAAALSLPLFPQSPVISNTVTALTVPDGLNGSTIVRHMYERYNTVIAGSRNKLDGKVIRIGTMGAVAEADILQDLLYLEHTLAALGLPVTPGAAVAAAVERLNQG
jgi:aspartate aminotransferase-like enzyme